MIKSWIDRLKVLELIAWLDQGISRPSPAAAFAFAVPPTGVSLDPATTTVGFDNSRVSFTSDHILVNWNGLSYVDGTVVKIDFAFVSVPEPASLALLGTAPPGRV